MALWLLGPDPVGTCCDCGARTSPCDNCTPLGCGIQCESNGSSNVTPCFFYPCFTLGVGTNCCTVDSEPGFCDILGVPTLVHLVQTANVRLALVGLIVG